MSENSILYVLYPGGEDITGEQEPPQREHALHRALADYLRWDTWLWGFQDLEDFIGPFNPFVMSNQAIWILSVPKESLRWCAFIRQNIGRPPEDIIFPDPETIRALSDRPAAAIKCPIKREWIKAVSPAREMLLAGRASA